MPGIKTFVGNLLLFSDIDEKYYPDDDINVVKIPKHLAGYIATLDPHRCNECKFFKRKENGCFFVEGYIKPEGSCNLYEKNDASISKYFDEIKEKITKEEAGYTEESPEGYYCKDCEYFMLLDLQNKEIPQYGKSIGICAKVYGVIGAYHCCNFYEKR